MSGSQEISGTYLQNSIGFKHNEYISQIGWYRMHYFLALLATLLCGSLEAERHSAKKDENRSYNGFINFRECENCKEIFAAETNFDGACQKKERELEVKREQEAEADRIDKAVEKMHDR